MTRRKFTNHRSPLLTSDQKVWGFESPEHAWQFGIDDYRFRIVEMRPAAARFELDSMIADIELTLVSIIQGVRWRC